MGFWGLFSGGDVGFWVKNGDWLVELWGLGKIGKEETFRNVQKRLKIFKKLGETFENIRKVM